MDKQAVRAGVRAAFDKLRAAYRELGGWRFPGYLDDPTMAYVGPWAWSEGDIQRNFANALAEECPPSGCMSSYRCGSARGLTSQLKSRGSSVRAA